MGRTIPPVSRFAVGVLALLATLPQPAAAVNVTAVLEGFPELAGFTRLLASSPVAGELAGRSSLTLLAVPDADLPSSPAAFAAASGADIADVLRYHVLLEYLGPADLHRLPSSGKLVTTLFQTTGRAPADQGAVNVTARGGSDGSAIVVSSPAPFPGSNVTVLGAVAAVPYNLSVLAVDGLIVPSGFDLAASESRTPAGVNITRILADARGFNVAASMLEASGVADEFEADERGAGITVFAPTDDAFAGLPATDRLQSLPADRKAVVLRFHVLHSYYPLGSLESIVNPLQPTLATEFTEAGRFTLNITRANGSVAIDTGVVQASITRTVFDQNPVAVFAVSKVLLPKEMFGRSDAYTPPAAPPPAAMPPNSPETARTPPTRLSSPPALRGADYSSSSSASYSKVVAWWCIALVYLQLQPLLLPPDGWPLGLRTVNIRAGMFRSIDLSGSFSFSTVFTCSHRASSLTSYDHDTESDRSFPRSRGAATLAGLMEVSARFAARRQSHRRPKVSSRSKSCRLIKAFLSLCRRARPESGNTKPSSLGQFLEMERIASRVHRRLWSNETS